MEKNGRDQRLYPRKLMKTRVVFEDEWGEGIFYLYAEDISLGGIFVSSEIPIKVGSHVFLSFYLPASQIKIRATGEVARVTREALHQGGPLQQEGMGIRFVDLAEETAKAVQDYIS